MRDLQVENDGNYATTIPIHETNTHPLMWCPPNPSFPSKFIITSFEHDGTHFVAQCSFTQEHFGEGDVPKEIVPIEQPQVNVINLLDDYVNNPLGPRHHTFVFNFYDVPNTCYSTTRSFGNFNYP